METSKDDTEPDVLTRTDEDDDLHVQEDATSSSPPTAAPPANPPKTKKGPAAGDESYEDGWYQVLKRRADGSDDTGE